MHCPSETIRLVLADDHPMTRQGLAYTLASEKDINIVAIVSDGNELVAAVREHHPHIVLTDLKMTRVHGPEACLQFLGEAPATGVIVYSMYDSEAMVRQMRGLGVRGYLLKNGNAAEICTAVRTVHAGGEYYSPSIRERTTRFFQEGSFGRGRGEERQEFTDVELQIIKFLCEDYTTKEIAAKLKMKERTVQAHKEKIEEKMGVRSVVGIVVYALQHYLLA